VHACEQETECGLGVVVHVDWAWWLSLCFFFSTSYVAGYYGILRIHTQDFFSKPVRPKTTMNLGGLWVSVDENT